MSRSYRTTPIIGNTGYSEKFDKQKEHRRWRVALRTAITHCQWKRAAWDRPDSCWTWNKDGKQWFGSPSVLPQGKYHHPSYQDQRDTYRKWLRK